TVSIFKPSYNNHKIFFSQKLDLRLLAPSDRVVVYETKSITCEITSRLLSISARYSRRPGSRRADAFRGHGFSLLEKTTLRGLQTPPGPAITAPTQALWSRRRQRPPLTRTGKAIYGKSLLLANAIPATRIHEDSCGRKGIGGTPQCVSTRRPTSRPRKA